MPKIPVRKSPAWFQHLVADADLRCGTAARQVPQTLLAAACGVNRTIWHRWRTGASVPSGPSGVLAESVLQGWLWLTSQEPVPKNLPSHTLSATFGDWHDRRVATWTADPTSLTLACLASARPGLLQLIAVATRDASRAADAPVSSSLNRDPNLESV